MKKIVYTGVFLFCLTVFSGCGNSYLEDTEEVSEEVSSENEDETEMILDLISGMPRVCLWQH